MAASLLLATASGRAQAATEFVDWSATSGGGVTGSLLGHAATLTGPTQTNVLDGTFTGFDSGFFAPPLASSDAVELRGLNGSSYTLSFGQTVSDPVFHLSSLASRISFPGGAVVTKLGGQDSLSVLGSTVVGVASGRDAQGFTDSNGTVRLTGSFSAISFTATPAFGGGTTADGIPIQVGASPPGAPPPPTPGPTPGPFPRPHPVPFPRTRTDIRVTGIEVTQGIQAGGCVGCAGTLPSRNQANATSPGRAAYQGVRMAAGNFTVVRVFVNFAQPTNRLRLTGATARLEVLDSDGRRISLLSPDSSPDALLRPGVQSCKLCVRLRDRADASASFNFLVPWQETVHRTLSFRATVTPPTGLGLYAAPVQCATCKANMFTLTGVPFVSTVTVPIHPIPLRVGDGKRTDRTENQVFGDAQTLLPVNLRIRPYEPELPLAAGTTSDQARAAVAKRASDDKLDSAQFPVGVFVNGTPGLRGQTGGELLRRPRRPRSCAEAPARSRASRTRSGTATSPFAPAR